MVRRELLGHLTAYLAGGGRKIDVWYASLKVKEVDFSDEADAFSNINTPEELKGADKKGPGSRLTERGQARLFVTSGSTGKPNSSVEKNRAWPLSVSLARSSIASVV